MSSMGGGYQGPSQFIEVQTGSEVYAVAFTPNGQHLISGCGYGVAVSQVRDGKPVATMPIQEPYSITCVAVSKDDRWIAAGSASQVLIWDTSTYKQVLALKKGIWPICDVDFSRNPASCLVSADGGNGTATVWDVATGHSVRTLYHSGYRVEAAKYSPQGDRIATAAEEESVRVWDSSNGRLLVSVKVRVDSWRSLLWLNNHLCVKTKDNEIKRIDASTGLTISGWPVPASVSDSSIALPHHGKFLAYSSRENITFWSTTTHFQLGFIPQSHDKCSIAFYPDSEDLAIAGGYGKTIIKNLSFITDLDGCNIDGAVLGSRKIDQLINAEALDAASFDPKIRGRSHHYASPETRRTIRAAIGNVIRDSPTVLINVISGSLYDKSEQAAAFESTPIFTELVTSMTIHIDHAHIQQAVSKFYRYATFSHTWEDHEPLFDKVTKILVYDLEASPTHEKLQRFCRIVREAGFTWAWSDTCCINKADHFVLQEALVSMFKWYEGSAMTIIFLRGVYQGAKRGAMMSSIWNLRGWTLQEYHASKVVQFYTEDWTPYLALGIHNHKQSPEIISEMEDATGISGQTLMALCPGLNDIRAKLHLASTRQTTRVEDAAYSLLGIFSTSLPVTYGEGDKALGRLLSQLLTNSGDTSILAWAGRSGSFNSCLPESIAVFSQSPLTHIPPPIVGAKMETSLNYTSAAFLYDQLSKLSVPSFAGCRMRLPCLTFKLGRLSLPRDSSQRVFRARTNALGIVEIRTEEDLSRVESPYLVHPWIDFLLDRRPVGGMADTLVEGDIHRHPTVSSQLSLPDTSNACLKTLKAHILGCLRAPSLSPPSNASAGGRSNTSFLDAASLSPPSTVSPTEKRTRVLQFIARLRQPFGALLLTQTRKNIEEYRRVAADSLITVRVREITPTILEKLTRNVRTLDVL